VSNFYDHVMLGLRIHFLYFKSTQCFQNMFFYQFVHSFESILGTRENFTAFTLQVYTHFFSKTSYDQRIFFFKEELDVISFQKHVGFSARQLIFLFSLFFLFFYLFISFSCLFLFFFPFFFHEVFCYLNMCIFLLGIFAIYMHKVSCYLNIHIYIL